MNWLNVVRGWVSPRKQKNGQRPSATLQAFYWSGGPVRPHDMQGLNENGAFIRTTELWGLGTRLQVRLQEHRGEEAGSDGCLSYLLEAVVTRCQPDGLEVQFLFPDRRGHRHFKEFLRTVNARSMEPVRQLQAGQSGHSLVEFALLIPLLFLLIVNAVNFGGFFYAWITVANAARSGAQYRIMGGATVTSPSPPNSTQVYNIIAQDMASLPNLGSLAVRVCTNTAGTVACNTTGSGSFANPTADTRSEASLFVMSWVDVQYTFQPLIPAFHFPGLGIHGTLPPTAVRRQAVMRMLQ